MCSGSWWACVHAEEQAAAVTQRIGSACKRPGNTTQHPVVGICAMATGCNGCGCTLNLSISSCMSVQPTLSLKAEIMCAFLPASQSTPKARVAEARVRRRMRHARTAKQSSTPSPLQAELHAWMPRFRLAALPLQQKSTAAAVFPACTPHPAPPMPLAHRTRASVALKHQASVRSACAGWPPPDRSCRACSCALDSPYFSATSSMGCCKRSSSSSTCRGPA